MMETLLQPFNQENWLQIIDHFITVLFGIASFILAIVIYRLSNRDKSKTLSIKELQAQTKKLEELYLYQLEPRFIAVHHNSGIVRIINIGGDCYNLKVSFLENKNTNLSNPFENWDNYFSRMTEKNLHYKDACGENTFKFSFEDICRNKFVQEFYPLKRQFSNLKKSSYF